MIPNDDQKASLMRKAVEKYGDISLCGPTKTWDECFTVNNGEVLFWFNVGKNTYCEKEVIQG